MKTGFGGFEIKREEKYFVFIWMSRKERAVAEKIVLLSAFFSGDRKNVFVSTAVTLLLVGNRI